ncbi:hypothetical protein [Cribrihabitans pelagius]|uniref:hypothetical protein n=1 Tax=Cribrihabitans pelagius TaxID=1765746 RepID=UPI003B5A8503
MKLHLRAYLGLLLALGVALTAHGAAAARGSGTASGQMVICTGSGAVTVYVDGEGRPVAPPHHCPDCVMQPLDSLAVAPAQLSPWRRSAVLETRIAEPVLPGSRAPLRALARAPPVRN